MNSPRKITRKSGKTTPMNDRAQKPANRTGKTSEGNIEKRKK